jgi:TatD DNase family protein
MDYAYMYGNYSRLYLNATNRCTNQCSFCIRNYGEGMGGSILFGGREPDFQDLRASVLSLRQLSDISEFVWCGFGEPTFRLDLILEAASWLRSEGANIRLNTNGHANIINGCDVLPELSKAIDSVSVSLNAPSALKYRELCQPASNPEFYWESMIDFLTRAPAYIKNVQASVVGLALTEAEIAQCRALVLSLGIKHFRVR